MLTPPKIQKLVGDAPLPGAACAAGIWFHTGGRDLPAGSDSIKGAARRAVPRWPTILATTEKHPPSFSIFVLSIILKATGGHVKIYSQLPGALSWNFWGLLFSREKKRERRCLLAAPACVPLGYYALSGAGKVIPPTLTFTAAISSPVMDSMAFFTPSCTARPTSGMVWP